MDIGTILLWLSLLPALSGIWFSIKYIRTKIKKYKNYAKDSTYLTTFFFSLSFGVFIYYCLTTNSDIFYSYYHTMPNYEWYYKLSAVWAGRIGSVFLWVFIVIGSLAITEYIFSKKDLNKQKLMDFARPITLTIILFFLGILMASRPFLSTGPELLARASSAALTQDLQMLLEAQWLRGAGMNSMLISPWMVIHPPVLFLGYGFFTIPLSGSLVFMITGRKDWYELSELWSRLGWLFLTIGIGIGAWWAYVTVGWGGYWAWDPVENASLIPWITSTAFLHLQTRYKLTNEYKYLSHVFTMLTFSLIVFGTLITRGGLAIQGSVHAYPGDIPLLRNMFYWTLMIAPIALGSLLLWKRYKINQ